MTIQPGTPGIGASHWRVQREVGILMVGGKQDARARLGGQSRKSPLDSVGRAVRGEEDLSS